MLVIGGGFAGLWAVRALRRARAEVLLVDRHNHHTFQPLLYHVATAGLAARRSRRHCATFCENSRTSRCCWVRPNRSICPAVG